MQHRHEHEGEVSVKTDIVEELRGIKVRVKAHFHDHKQLYQGIAIGAGVAGVLLGVKRPEFKQVVDSYKLQLWSPTTNIIETNLTRRGHPGYIVKCLETGEHFASQARAAAANGINPAQMSKHLGGSVPDLKGLHFERIREAV